MADKVKALTPEEFRDVRQFATLDDALQYWASSRDPVIWNDWQPVFGQIRRLFLGKDPQVQQVSSADLARESSAAWKRTMEALHGSDWKKKARSVSQSKGTTSASAMLKQSRADGPGAAMPTGSPEAGDGSTRRPADGALSTAMPTRVPEAGSAPAETAQGGGLVVPRRLALAGFPVEAPERLGALAQSFAVTATRPVPARTTSDPGLERPQEYSIFTERRARSSAGSDTGGGVGDLWSHQVEGDAEPMSDAVVPFEGIGRTGVIPELDLVIPKDLYEIMRDKEPKESETSSAYAERLEGIGADLRASDRPEAQVHLAIVSEMYLRDLKAMHTEETQGNPRASREVWALRKLTTHSFDSVSYTHLTLPTSDLV